MDADLPQELPPAAALDPSYIASLDYFKVLGLHKDAVLVDQLKSLAKVDQDSLKLTADLVEQRYRLKQSEENAKTAIHRVKKREVIAQLEKGLRKHSTSDPDTKKRRDKITAKLDALKSKLREDVLANHLPTHDLELTTEPTRDLHHLLLSADMPSSSDNDASDWSRGPLSAASLSASLSLHNMSVRLRTSEFEALQLDHCRVVSRRQQLNDAITNTIRAAHKRLSVRLHPDKLLHVPTPEDVAAYQEVLTAYQILSDPDYRAAYLRSGGHRRWLQSDRKKEIDRKAAISVDKKDSLRERLAQAIGASPSRNPPQTNDFQIPGFPISHLFLEGGKPHRPTLPTISLPLKLKKTPPRLRVAWNCAHAAEYRVLHYILEAAAVDSPPSPPAPAATTTTKPITVPFPTTSAFTIIYCGADMTFTTEPFPPGAYTFRVRAFNALGPGMYSMTASCVIPDPAEPATSSASSTRATRQFARRVRARNALEEGLCALEDVVAKVNKNTSLTDRVMLLTELISRAKRCGVEQLDPALVKQAEGELKGLVGRREGREEAGAWRKRLKGLVEKTMGEGEVEEEEEGEKEEEREVEEEEEDSDDEYREDVIVTTIPPLPPRRTSAALARFVSTVPLTQTPPAARNMIMQSCLKAVERCPRMRITVVKKGRGSGTESSAGDREGGNDKWDIVRQTPPGRCWQIVQAVRARTDLFSRAWVVRVEMAWARVERGCEVVFVREMMEERSIRKVDEGAKIREADGNTRGQNDDNAAQYCEYEQSSESCTQESQCSLIHTSEKRMACGAVAVAAVASAGSRDETKGAPGDIEAVNMQAVKHNGETQVVVGPKNTQGWPALTVVQVQAEMQLQAAQVDERLERREIGEADEITVTIRSLVEGGVVVGNEKKGSGVQEAEEPANMYSLLQAETHHTVVTPPCAQPNAQHQSQQTSTFEQTHPLTDVNNSWPNEYQNPAGPFFPHLVQPYATHPPPYPPPAYPHRQSLPQVWGPITAPPAHEFMQRYYPQQQQQQPYMPFVPSVHQVQAPPGLAFNNGFNPHNLPLAPGVAPFHASPHPALASRSNSAPALIFGEYASPPQPQSAPTPDWAATSGQSQHPPAWPVTSTQAYTSAAFSPFDSAGASPASSTSSSSLSCSPAGSLAALLDSLGLARYIPVFCAQEIDLDALALMDHVDLELLGVPLGPRLKILEAARASRVERAMRTNNVFSVAQDVKTNWITPDWLRTSNHPLDGSGRWGGKSGFVALPSFPKAPRTHAGEMEFGWGHGGEVGADPHGSALDGMVSGIVDGWE